MKLDLLTKLECASRYFIMRAFSEPKKTLSSRSDTFTINSRFTANRLLRASKNTRKENRLKSFDTS